MRQRWANAALIGTGWLLFVAAIVLPAAAMVLACVTDRVPPQGGFTWSARQFALLGKTILLAAAGSVSALILAVPAALSLADRRGPRRDLVLLGLAVLVLLTPPMVYAFGWEHVFPPKLGPYVRCVGVWTAWGWPLAAILFSVGWVRAGRSAYESALLSTSPVSAFLRIGLPSIRAHVGAAAALLFILFFNDYGTPHACGLILYSVELMSWAANSSSVMDTIWPALPAIVLTLAMLGFAWRWMKAVSALVSSDARLAAVPAAHFPWVATVSLFLVTWVLPLGALLAQLGDVSALREAIHVYGGDLAWTVAVALASGTASVVLGIGVLHHSRGRRFAVVCSLAFGLFPAALVGQSLIAAYNHAATGWLYDRWPILVLAYVARFGWIGLLTAWVLRQQVPREILEQARIDGADRWAVLTQIQLRLNGPTALAGVAIIAAQAAAEAAASTLVRVPSFNPISHVLIEKFHRFELDMLVSLSLWLVLLTLVAAILVVLSFARFQNPAVGPRG